MRIRPYQTGDEGPQARVYNAAAGTLPAFKPATAEEIARRYRAGDADPLGRFYAVDEATGGVVGYALFGPNGRVSYPWCLPGFEAARTPLLDAALGAMTGVGLTEAWAAYRADWAPVLDFFGGRGFTTTREMVNFVAATDDLPASAAPLPGGLALGPLGRDDLPRLAGLGRGIFAADDPERLAAAYWENPFFGPECLFAVRDGRGAVVGAAVAIASTAYADPAKLDAAMPCFRLGVLGTERERHKRVNGLVSCLFDDGAVGEALLAEAARRFRAAGLTHAAAQAPSDRPELLAFYGRHFERQGAFPILSLPLTDASARPS